METLKKVLKDKKTFLALWLPWLAALAGLLSYELPNFLDIEAADPTQVTWLAFALYTLYALQQTFQRLGTKKAQEAVTDLIEVLKLVVKDDPKDAIKPVQRRRRRDTRHFGLLLVVLAFSFPFVNGCTPKGTIRASEVAEAVHRVTGRHDKYVKSDETLSALEKRSYLRTSELLKATVDEALNTKSATDR